MQQSTHEAVPVAAPTDTGSSTSETEFRRLLSKLPAAAYTCDADGLITYCNDKAMQLWGRTPRLHSQEDRYCGSFRLFALDGTPIPHERCWMALALQTGKEYNGQEILIEREDCTRVAVLAHANPIRDADGRILGAVNILIDISDRRRAEEALRATQGERDDQLADLTRLNQMSTRLSATFELQPILQEVLDTACAIDRTELGLLALCEGETDALKIAASAGFDTGSVRDLAAVSGAGTYGTAFMQRRRVVVEDVEAEGCFAPHLEAARRARFRALHSTPLITRSGRIIGVLATFARHPRRPSYWQIHLLDLCARQAADFIENARLYAQVNETQRRKDEFLAVLAHELRNPLAPIQNAVQILLLPGAQQADRHWAGEVIDRQVRHMARLVDDLLDLQRISTGKLHLRKAPIEVRAVVGAALETSRPLIDSRGQNLVLELSSEPIYLDGDQTRLAQVVADLLDNAAKFTPHSGTITVRTERDAGDVLIRVRDTGIGIPPEGLERIFQLFARSQPAGEYAHGELGVGLTLAKRLVELHDGVITASSEGIDRGSEFVVRLPALAQAPRGVEQAGAQRSAAPAGLRVVIVDDNRDSAASLGLMLSLMGNEVRTGHDGREAVALAEAFRPDAVLLDIGLPVLSGYEAAREIRRKPWAQSCVLVAITGWGQESDRARSREAGFDHHLVKPLEVAALVDILAQLPRRRDAAGHKKGRRSHASRVRKSPSPPAALEDQAIPGEAG